MYLLSKLDIRSKVEICMYYANKICISTKFKICTIVYLENAWALFSMITEGEAAILLETTRHALGNQWQSKQRSTLCKWNIHIMMTLVLFENCQITDCLFTIMPSNRYT